MAAVDGLLVVDKPGGWTSHDVVAKVRRLAGTRRVGHAGTLDPMATGVLVLGIGRGTRLLTFLVGCDKAYTATIRLGQASTTDDADGVVTATADVEALTPDAVTAGAAALTGRFEQVPSVVSAVKVDGKRAYVRVRAGEDVVLAPRPVAVHRFDVLGLATGTAYRKDGSETGVLDVDVAVEVSAGTYVRALARDLGAALGVGGHLTRLRRTRVGRFAVDSAHGLSALEAAGPGLLPLVSLADAARTQFPVHELTAEEAVGLSHGRRIGSACGPAGGVRTAVAGIGPDGRLIAMLDESAPQARAHVVFAPSGS
ncbi:MAG: tRNA pseudouridine(55) synthase TruB [Dermatophilaceae bacterium]